MDSPVLEQENKVNLAFSNQAPLFDELDRSNPILQRMRTYIRQEVQRTAKAGGTILELNSGTGLDAVYFAQQGFIVHATDNAEGMLTELNKKITAKGLEKRITTERCSFNELEKLRGRTYDHIFSNFGGLNCTAELAAVIGKMKPLLNHGGTVTLVIMPRICPWEIAQLFRGKFRLAFRRLKRGGAVSHLEGVHFLTWYYSPKYVKKAFGKEFSLVSLKGLASLSPPPYAERFPKRFPKLYRTLCKIDERLAGRWPFRYWADHYLISFRKN